jgi:hypothetical protein
MLTTILISLTYLFLWIDENNLLTWLTWEIKLDNTILHSIKQTSLAYKTSSNNTYIIQKLINLFLIHYTELSRDFKL